MVVVSLIANEGDCWSAVICRSTSFGSDLIAAVCDEDVWARGRSGLLIVDGVTTPSGPVECMLVDEDVTGTCGSVGREVLGVVDEAAIALLDEATCSGAACASTCIGAGLEEVFAAAACLGANGFKAA